jgi:hypothetical protein
VHNKHTNQEAAESLFPTSNNIMGLSLDQKIANVREELELMRTVNRRETLRNRLDVETMKGRKAALEREFARSQEVAQQAPKLHMYVEMLQKSSHSDVVVSNYVLYIEAQACRALHCLKSLQKQAKIQQEMYDDLCQSMRTLMKQMKSEKGLCQNYYGLLHAKVRKEQGKLTEKKSKKIEIQGQVLARLRMYSEYRQPEQKTAIPRGLPPLIEKADLPPSMFMTMFGRATSLGSLRARATVKSLSPQRSRETKSLAGGEPQKDIFHIVPPTTQPVARSSRVAEVA